MSNATSKQIAWRTKGIRHTDVNFRTRTGKKEILEKLGEGKIGPDQFRMRLHLTFETGDERYTWLNSAVFIASSGRVGDMVIYDAYQVL